MPNAAPLSAPEKADAATETPKTAPVANMAQRLRNVEKTANYLGAAPTRKAPTPAVLPAQKSSSRSSAPGTPTLRRSSGRRPVVPGSAAQPGASGTRAIPQPQWHCEHCHVPVDKEGIVAGTCKLIGGQLYCLRCYQKRTTRRQLRFTLWAVGAVLLIGLALSAVFLTQPLLILLLPIGALAVLTGVIGGGLQSAARLAFVAAGLAAIVASCWGTGVVSERNESRQAQQTFEKEAVQTKELIDTNDIAQADTRLESLAAQSKDRAGHYLSPERERKLAELRQRLSAQIKSTYGELSEHEYHVLLTLIRAFPDSASSGAQRVHAVHMSETKLAVSVEKNRDVLSDKDMPPGPQGDLATLQGRTLALFLFDSYPFLKEVEVEVTGDKPQRATYTREQITQLRMGGLSAPPGVSTSAR